MSTSISPAVSLNDKSNDVPDTTLSSEVASTEETCDDTQSIPAIRDAEKEVKRNTVSFPAAKKRKLNVVVHSRLKPTAFSVHDHHGAGCNFTAYSAGREFLSV